MVQRRVRQWIVTLVCIAALAAPASLSASGGAEPSSSLGFWQTLQQVWLEWSAWWTGTARGHDVSLRSAQAAADDEGGILEIVPLDPPVDAEMFESGESGDGEDDGDVSPNIDPIG